MPTHLRKILDDLEKSEQEARRVAGGLSDVQVNWQPAQNAWSIAQCLDHLTRGNTIYAAALHEAVTRPRTSNDPQPGPIQPGWFSRYFIRTLEPPPKRKLRAPKKIVPASRLDAHDVLECFLRSQDDMPAVIHAGAALDLNRIRLIQTVQ